MASNNNKNYITEERLQFMLDKQRQEIAEDNEKIYFKYKSELIDLIDPILKEVVYSRQDRTVLSHRVSKIEDELQISA